MWSPASTMRVVLLARAKGMMVSHSMAWAASSNRIWVNKPIKTDKTQISIHLYIYYNFTASKLLFIPTFITIYFSNKSIKVKNLQHWPFSLSGKVDTHQVNTVNSSRLLLILNKMFIFSFLLFVMLTPLIINLKKSYINKILQICHTETTNIHALRPNSFFVCLFF